jgi:hypothetical protein
MDEPFSALDAMMRVELQDLLLKLWTDLGLTILFVTHDLDEALYVAQRVILLSASPGTIAQNVAVPLPSPRRQIETRSEPEYLRLREHLFRNMVAQVIGRPGGRTVKAWTAFRDSRAPGVILLALLLFIWQLSATYWFTSPTWPTVTRIFEAWFENIADGTIPGHLIATLWRQMLGYGLAIVIGITLGLAMGYYRPSLGAAECRSNDRQRAHSPS